MIQDESVPTVTTAHQTEQPLGKKTTRGVAWSFLREGVTEALVFPLSMVLARILTPREFGIAAAASFFVLLAGKLSELGFNVALVRAKTLEPIHFSTVFMVNLVIGVVTFLVLTSLAPLVARFYDTPETGAILPIAATAFLIVPFGAVPAAIMLREFRYRQGALADWYYSLTFSILTVVLAWMGFSYMSMVYGRVTSLAVLTLSRMWYARWYPSFSFSRKALGEVLSFGLGVHAKRLLDFSAQNIDNLLIGRLFGMEALGFYDKAFSTVNRFLVRMNTGGPGVVFRSLAMMQDEPERFRRAYSKVVMSATLLAFPMFAGLITAAPQFIVVLFGERWLNAARPFQLLCLAACFKLLNLYASSANQAMGTVWSEVWRQLLYVGLIVAGLIAARGFGTAGAALVVLLATGAMTVLMHLLLTTATPVRWVDIAGPQVPALVCAAAVAAGELLISSVFSFAGYGVNTPLWLLAAQAAGAGVIYVAFVLFAPHKGLRALVRDVTDDLAPDWFKRHRLVQRYRASYFPDAGPAAG